MNRIFITPQQRKLVIFLARRSNFYWQTRKDEDLEPLIRQAYNLPCSIELLEHREVVALIAKLEEKCRWVNSHRYKRRPYESAGTSLSPAQDCHYRAGMKVSHPSRPEWGIGTITDVAKFPNHERLYITWSDDQERSIYATKGTLHINAIAKPRSEVVAAEKRARNEKLASMARIIVEAENRRQPSESDARG